MNHFIRLGLFKLSTMPVDNSVEKSADRCKKGLKNVGLNPRHKNYAAIFLNKFNRLLVGLSAWAEAMKFELVKG